MSARTCAVTGASGYVGSRIVEQLRRERWRVLELRRDTRAVGADRIPYSLEEDPPAGALAHCNALVHCAYDFRPVRWDDIARVNVEGSRRLLGEAAEAGVTRIVVVSTLSAFEGCRSLYGRAKLAIEEIAARIGAARIRPGLVWGDRPGGTLGALDRVVATTPIVPLPGDGRHLQYLCHEEDLARAIRELLDRTEAEIPAPIVAAAEEPLTLRGILETLAERRGKRVSFLRVPEGWALAGLRAVEAAGLRAGFRSDSLVSLMNQNPAPDFGAAHALGIPFRAFGGAP